MAQEMSLKRLRHNMIEQQLRTWSVLDERVLSLYDSLLREQFVPDSLKPLAYADMALPIDEGQTMLEPKLEARMLQELAPQGGETILHIGCGSGYFAALLGQLAKTVYSAEIRPQLASDAQAKLSAMNVNNVDVICTDAANGLAAHAPYDAIVLTGSIPVLPDDMIEQLTPNGRLLAVVGQAPAMHLCLYIKQVKKSHLILETQLPPLDNMSDHSDFDF